MTCNGCAQRRETIVRVGRRIIAAFKPTKAPPPVVEGENAGRRLVRKGGVFRK